MMIKPAVLCFLRQPEEILLARKTRGIGAGLRNGYGGFVEPDETIEDAIHREVCQESKVCVDPRFMSRSAVMSFHGSIKGGQIFVCEVHVFFAYRWIGEPQATDEMSDPRWFPVDKMPYRDMMAIDRKWLPFILHDCLIIGTSHGHDERIEIDVVNGFPQFLADNK